MNDIRIIMYWHCGKRKSGKNMRSRDKVFQCIMFQSEGKLVLVIFKLKMKKKYNPGIEVIISRNPGIRLETLSPSCNSIRWSACNTENIGKNRAQFIHRCWYPTATSVYELGSIFPDIFRVIHSASFAAIGYCMCISSGQCIVVWRPWVCVQHLAY